MGRKAGTLISYGSTAVPNFEFRGSSSQGTNLSSRLGQRANGRRGRRSCWRASRWREQRVRGQRGRRSSGGGCGRFVPRYTLALYPLSCFFLHTQHLNIGLTLILLPTSGTNPSAKLVSKFGTHDRACSKPTSIPHSIQQMPCYTAVCTNTELLQIQSGGNDCPSPSVIAGSEGDATAARARVVKFTRIFRSIGHQGAIARTEIDLVRFVVQLDLH